MLRSDPFSFFPLPRRILPYPWEDLASFISRVAECMGYKNPQWLLRPEESSSTIQPFNLCILREKTDYLFFEHLLRLDKELLYSLTLHSMTFCMQDLESFGSNGLSEIQRPLLPRYVFQTFFQPYFATKVCSACLADEPAYGRLYWNVLPVVACLRHNIFLTHQCPSCLCSIPLLRSSLSHCPRCKKGDYRLAPAVPFSGERYFREGQTTLQHYLGVEDGEKNGYTVINDVSPLSNLLPWQYFHLLDAFRCIFGPLFPHAPFLQGSPESLALLRQHPRPHSTLSWSEWSVIISTFHWLFLDWPNNFFSFLTTFPHVKSSRVRKRDQRRIAGVQHDFGVFYEKWLYKRLTHPAFTFLHEAFEDYLRVHYTSGEVTSRLHPFKGKSAEKIQERPYLTKVQARALLGIGEDMLQSLLQQGILRAIKKPIGSAGKRHLFLIEKSSIEVLQQAWGELIPLDVLAKSYLGTTKAIVLALEDAGMLLSTRGSDSDRYKQRLYTQAAIEQFEKVVLSHAIKPHELFTEAVVPLPMFASKAGVSLITLVGEILGDHLLPIETGKDQPLFQRLVLPEGEIGKFLEVYKRRQRERQNLLTPGEVAIDLGISKRVLERWVQCGLIEGEKLSIDGKKPSLLFRRKSVEIFRLTYAFTEEVATLLGVVPHTVSKYVRKGLLHPVAGKKTHESGNRLVFRHDEIESLVNSRCTEDNRCKNIFVEKHTDND